MPANQGNGWTFNTVADIYEKIKDTINRHGGSISIFDTLDLQMARKA